MLTNQETLTLLKKVVSQDGTANDSYLQQLINSTHKLVLGRRDWSFTEATFTATSTASQQSIKLPVDYRKLSTNSITIGNTKYTAREIADPKTFDEINSETTHVTSDFMKYIHIRNGVMLAFPAISSAGLTLTMEYYRLPKDMGAVDYSTGTISALANGATAVTGSGTTLTAAMVGRYIRITSDGYWYKIATYTSATSIGLDKPYQGTTISAGSEAYLIGELSLIPEEFGDLLWLRPASIYYMMKNEEVRANYYKKEFSEMLDDLKTMYSSKTGQVVTNDSLQFGDPNSDPRSITLT